jgi:hypothetical protein
MKMTFQEIRIIVTGPCIANHLRDVNTICRRSWYIAAHVWKIYDLLEPLISHTGILMTFYLSIILDLQNFFHWYILQSWKLKRPPIELRPHHFWTYTSNLTTVINSVLQFMINGTTSIFYHRLCRDGRHFEKILVSEYKLFKRSNKANLCIALVQ